ncbi:MAG: CDP-alcohol phosphatidyltransferase family protein [Clostridia bacterium]|nr:CDP-alcohol phosphatidyltransferase family protein [Clostridia bacterium]
MRFIGFYDYTVILTYMSLVSGLLGIGFAANGRHGAAIICLTVCGILDMFDGAVARTKKDRTEDEKSFGIQLDSLCDIVCFGVLPAWFLYCFGPRTAVSIAVLIAYVLCALIRLAFFNVLEAKRQKTEDGCARYYRGLPVTSASIAFPFFYLLSGILPNPVEKVIWAVLPVLMGFLFVLDIKVPKFNVSKLLAKRKDEKEIEVNNRT